MQFIDKAKIYIEAGKGGDGTVAFRREAHVPKGGPAGGDGGKGGSIIFEATTSLSTLLDLKYKRVYKARPGGNGMAKKMHGADASDLVIKVPVGTVITNEETGKIMADLTEDRQRVVLAKGGRGGRGNARFATSRNPAPQICERGEPGEKFDVCCELKLLADYHFTTIVPNLGVVQAKDGRNFVMADLPGLIEGASQGKGLGHQFLRHIERCRVIVHIIDMGGIEGRDPYEDYCTINEELGQYQYRLLERPQIVVANKMDEENAEENLKAFKEKVGEDVKVFPISAIIHEGVDQVLYAVADALETAPKFDMEEVEENTVVYNYEEEEAPFVVHNLGNGQWTITGKKIERLVSMTSLVSDDAIKRLSIKMRNMGIDEALRNAGCQDGDVVSILDFEFEFYD